MGMTSARKLKKIVQNVSTIMAIELMCACQAFDMRKTLPIGQGTRRSYDILRSYVPPLYEDRIVAKDIEQAIHALKLI
jgi:histidine ammonia-lyase